MGKPEIQFRFMQVGCIALVLWSIGLSLRVQKTTHEIAPIHWLLIVLAIWSAVSGFTMQHRIVNGPTRTQRRTKTSTPFRRWRAGNLLRLASAASVGLYGLVLCEFGAPAWTVKTIFAIGLLLLLIWRPGASPAPTQPAA